MGFSVGVMVGFMVTMLFVLLAYRWSNKPAPASNYLPVPADLRGVPDPSGMRRAFFDAERIHFLEIGELAARETRDKGGRIFGHPFDPIEISHFDANGFQVWAIDGYRFEAVRYYRKFQEDELTAACGHAGVMSGEVCARCGSKVV